VSPSGAAAIFRLNTTIDVRPILPTIRVPTLVLHRRGDRVVPVESGRYVASQIPGARFVELPGDSHLNFVGNADAVADEIEEFLTGVRPARQPERVLATVVFTDIVSSTERAASLGDRRWRELLDQLDHDTGRAVAWGRGRLVKSTGDGHLAIFDGPARPSDPVAHFVPRSAIAESTYVSASTRARSSCAVTTLPALVCTWPSECAHSPGLVKCLSHEPSSISWRGLTSISRIEAYTNSRDCPAPGTCSLPLLDPRCT